MNRRLLILPGTIALIGAIVLGACSSSTPAATGSAAATAGATSAAPPTSAAATVAVPSGGTSQLCAGKPQFNPLASSQPSFGSDPDLTAKFPQQIAGDTASDLISMKFADFLCLFGGLGADQAAAAFSQAGGDITTASFGSASYSVNSESISLQALRTPGGDANKMITGLAQLFAALGATSQIKDVQQANVGGKNVFSSKQATGETTYAYPGGDTLWFFSSTSDQTAATVLSALP